jgi:hypothetical protein
MNLERSGDHMPRSAPPQSIERAEKNLHNPLPPPRARKPYYVTCKPLRSQSDEIVASHMSTSTRGRPGWETGLARKAVAENLVQSGYGGTDGRTGEDDCGTATANPRLAIHCHSLPWMIYIQVYARMTWHPWPPIKTDLATSSPSCRDSMSRGALDGLPRWGSNKIKQLYSPRGVNWTKDH